MRRTRSAACSRSWRRSTPGHRTEHSFRRTTPFKRSAVRHQKRCLSRGSASQDPLLNGLQRAGGEAAQPEGGRCHEHEAYSRPSSHRPPRVGRASRPRGETEPDAVRGATHSTFWRTYPDRALRPTSVRPIVRGPLRHVNRRTISHLTTGVVPTAVSARFRSHRPCTRRHDREPHRGHLAALVSCRKPRGPVVGRPQGRRRRVRRCPPRRPRAS